METKERDNNTRICENQCDFFLEKETHWGIPQCSYQNGEMKMYNGETIKTYRCVLIGNLCYYGLKENNKRVLDKSLDSKVNLVVQKDREGNGKKPILLTSKSV